MLRRICVRMASSKDYDKFFEENIEKISQHIQDARVSKAFSIKELKKKVSPEVWEKMTEGDPLLKMKELEDIGSMEDVTAHKSKYLPAHLTRPAALLDERQRKAKYMSLDFEADESRLQKQRGQEWSAFPTLTEDNYEIWTGLILERDPIWLRLPQMDAEFAKFKTHYMEKHNQFLGVDKQLDDYIYSYPGKTEEERRTYDQKIKTFDKTRELPTTTIPGSVFWLDVNPTQTDHSAIQYAPAYRTYLLLKDRETKKWDFPRLQMFGQRSFLYYKKRMINSLLNPEALFHHLGPSSALAHKEDFETKYGTERPVKFSEDIYRMVYERTKVLFPQSSDSEIEKYLFKRYDMVAPPLDRNLEVKGRVTFYFKSLHYEGDVKLINTDKYEDMAWVPKPEMNKFLSREDFSKFIHTFGLH